MNLFDHFSEQERQILLARARRVASTSEGASEGETETALTVTIREERYALPLPSLVNVHEHIAIIPVPCVPRHVAGIANIRGHIIPVLDLGVLMDVPGMSTSKNSTLVVAAHNDLKVAFLVERIGDVASYTVNSVAPVPMNLDNRQTVAYVQGILPGGAALLNIDAILDDNEITVNEKVN